MAVKILSGIYKGRVLTTPADASATRPTAVRTRKMIFDMLSSDKKCGRDWSSFRVIDFCAGAGLLGFEAMSRGADKLLLVESSGSAVAAIGQNMTALALGARAVLLAMKLKDCWAVISPVFRDADIIFADPPYQRPDLVQDIINQVPSRGLLAKDGFLVLQTQPDFLLPADSAAGGGWQVVDQRKEGNAKVWFLQYRP